MNTEPIYRPGLEGVVAGESSICRVRPDADVLIYRGYDCAELARRARFEEVAYLLIEGKPPNKSELARFRDAINAERELPGALIDMIRALPPSMHPMDVLRTGVSASAGWDPDVGDNSHDANVRKAIRLMAKIPAMLGVRQASLDGREPVSPDPGLNHAGNLLLLLRGAAPDEDEIALMNCSLTLYAEHGFNASTFTARVCASTLADMHAAVTGAIGALKGPLHGGANEAAMAMLEEVGEIENAEAWVMDKLAKKAKIMGFGHRVYKKCDGRAVILRAEGRKMAEKRGDLKYADMADIIEGVIKREKNLFPNVDFPCGWVYRMLGLPVDMYTPIFVVSRISGWAAHVIEQHDNNRLIRPKCKYTGSMEMNYEPPQ